MYLDRLTLSSANSEGQLLCTRSTNSSTGEPKPLLLLLPGRCNPLRHPRGPQTLGKGVLVLLSGEGGFQLR